MTGAGRRGEVVNDSHSQSYNFYSFSFFNKAIFYFPTIKFDKLENSVKPFESQKKILKCWKQLKKLEIKNFLMPIKNFTS